MKQVQQSLFAQLPPVKPVPALRGRVVRPAPLQRRVPLWLAVHLPFLSLDALLREPRGQTPCAVIDPDAGVARIHAANASALNDGVTAGMTLAAAWALLPDLEVHERDVRREQRLLRRLVAWANRFTPTVCIDTQSLLLEVRGSLQLFKGVAGVRAAVNEDMERLGFNARTAIAPTPRAALWLARAGHEVVVEQLDSLPSVLAGLPLAAAGFEPELLEKLNGIGARQLRDVLRLPREGFARRYGARILRELDEAVGRVADVRQPIALPPGFSTRCDLHYEISEAERLLHPVQQLLQQLDDYLRTTQQGVNRLQLRLFYRDRTFTDVLIGFAEATRDAVRIEDLVEQRLETLELPAPVLGIRLDARELHALAGRDRALFIHQINDGEDGWSQLVERLSMRLGAEAVSSIEQQQDHRPERSWRFVAPGTAREQPGRADRPQWLLEMPQALRVQNGRPVFCKIPLDIIDGPERIETGWWDEADVTRDYFIARDTHGRHLWICREVKTGRWWLQGIFA